MEDLKKQTALRLAQEQQHKESRAFPNTYAPTALEAVLDAPAPQRLTQTGAQADRLSYAGPHDRSYPPQPVDPSSQYHAYDLPYPVQQGGFEPTSQGRMAVPSPSKEQRSVSSQSSSSRDVPSQGDKARQKSKLPHGLTVQELKEMTKARLQSEAGDPVDSPLGLSEPQVLVPSHVKVLPDFPEQISRNAVLASPVPPSFHSHRPVPRSPYQDGGDPYRSRDAWSQDSRGDAWETGSVSTAASDFLGSEYSGVNNNLASHSGEEFSSAVPFARSRSNPTTGAHGGPLDRPYVASPSPGQSYYDPSSSYAANRRRAATLSPRVGLSHVHEDRPVFAGQDMPAMPSFSTPNTRRPLPARTHSAVAAESYRYGQGSGVMGSVEENRQRTSSTTSLPAMSHTAEEFAVEQTRFTSPFGTVREDAPSPSVTGLKDVFRESPIGFGSPSPTTSLLTGTERVGVSASTSHGFGQVSSMDSFGDSRIRSATWGEPSSDMFGPSLFGSSADQDALAGDLASILKLCGAEEKSGNSFYPPPGL